MVQKQQNITQEEDTLRYKILPLFKTNVPNNIIPLHAIEMVFEVVSYLQALKYCVDYFTIKWIGSFSPIFSYLDFSYYLNYGNTQFYQPVLIGALVFMNLYWLVQLSMFLLGKTYSNPVANVRKLIFIFTKNILFLPLFNIVLDLNNCLYANPFRNCYNIYSNQLQGIAFFSLAVFTLFIAAQTFFNFQFLPSKKDLKRMKHSSFGSLGLLAFMMLNQMAAYICADNVQLIILDILIVLKDEQINERARQIELSFHGVNILALILINVVFFTGQQLSILLFFFLATFMVTGLMQLRTCSLKFQLQNINKWPTANIMIRYTNTLRYYLFRKDQYIFKVYIHGYMEMHRQKCDSIHCPSRTSFTQAEKRLFDTGVLSIGEEQLLRFENIVKLIFSQGFKLTPISAELQLQYAIFLYQLGQKQLSLKNLLLLQYKELSLDRYYCYNLLKEKIHQEMIEEPNKRFLDLVSDLQVKREEDQILIKLQKAALINLQFWSVLNQDHPDFQKLNQIAASRIKIRNQIKINYQSICLIAHSQKMTRLFVHYLESIENDEAMYNEIYKCVKESYQLQGRIVLQDWSNTSDPILLTSIQDSNYGTIIDINSSCASLFGYERFQILNRPLKLLFTDDLKEGVKDFLLPEDHQGIYFMTHKSGYLLKVKKRSQNYNSMETGLASIITLTIQLNPNSCFFVVANISNKIVGISASTISLLGMQSKAFENVETADNFFNMGIAQMQSMTQERDKIYNLRDLINKDFQNQITNYGTKTFKLSFEQALRCIGVELTVIKPKEKRKRQRETMKVLAFQFQVQASMQSFKYFGNFNHQETYLSQFSQLNYAQSLKQGNNNDRNYAQGISTLRLKNNIIQVIEENDQQQVDGFQRQGSQVGQQIQNIPRKDEQEIFKSKTSFEQFISNYKFADSAHLIMGLGLAGLLGLYISYYFLFCQHNNTAMNLTSQIAYQNLIIGGVTKELSLMYSLQQMTVNQSYYTPNLFTKMYFDNIQYLQSIKLNGANPYQIQISLGNTTQTFLTDEFLLSFINYALSISSQITVNSSIANLVSAYKTSDPYAIQYILMNGASAKQIMIQAAQNREKDIFDIIVTNMHSQVLMLVGGLLFVTVFSVFMFMTVHRINQEKIQIFEVFLDITEIQIQQFSSKTQKFLMSLHVEDTNGEIDVDEEVENTKKINSSTFAKKKRFKLVSFSKAIYCKLMLIPLFSIAYFIHSFALSYLNLTFQANSYDYFFQTAAGDYQFYSGLAKIQSAILTNNTIPTQIGEVYMVYYRNYFDLHYNTFGSINDFHQTFTDVFMLDICHGINTPYGNTSILQSCQLPELYPNGSYFIFTDAAMRTQFLNGSSSLTYDYLLSYDVLSKTHRLLTQNLLTAQNNLINSTLSSLLTSLLIWILVMSCVAFLYGMPTMKNFVDEVNEVKNILSILPLTAVKQLPLATKYFNKILKSDNCCC